MPVPDGLADTTVFELAALRGVALRVVQPSGADGEPTEAEVAAAEAGEPLNPWLMLRAAGVMHNPFLIGDVVGVDLRVTEVLPWCGRDKPTRHATVWRNMYAQEQLDRRLCNVARLEAVHADGATCTVIDINMLLAAAADPSVEFVWTY